MKKLITIILLLFLFTACAQEQPINKDIPVCEDLCGDGTCQEFVCMSVGCPCAESIETCPQDCKS